VGIRMAGFIARLLLWQIVGADRNPSARVHVKPMNDPAPSIAQESVRMGFISHFDPDTSCHRVRSAHATQYVKAFTEVRTLMHPSFPRPSPNVQLLKVIMSLLKL